MSRSTLGEVAACPPPPSKITSVAIPTKNRPESLRLCLQSLAENFVRHHRQPQILVIDTSTSRVMVDDNRRNIEDIISSNPTLPPILHVSPAKIQTLIEKISNGAGINPSLVTFALRGIPEIPTNTGASRNIHVLSTQGQLTITIDDDIICRIYAGARSSPLGLKYGNAYARTSFYPDRDTLDRSLVTQDIDLLSLHESALARTLKECSHAINAKYRFSAMHRATEPRGPGAKNHGGQIDVTNRTIRATITGVAGTITHDTPLFSYFPALMDGSCAPATEADHIKLLTSGQTVRLASEYIVSEGLITSGYCLGLNNTVLLPPWLPVLRSQDIAFGTLLRTLFPKDFLCILPWAVRHERAETRLFSRKGIRIRFAQVTAGELINNLIGDLAPQNALDTSSKKVDLKVAGDYMMEFAEGSLTSFDAKVHAYVRRELIHRLRFLELVLLKMANGPSYIQEEVRANIGEIQLSLAKPEHSCPDLNTFTDARKILKNIVGQYGGIMKEWEDMARIVREILQRESCFT